ncbi:Ger(x)C family spore germination protein [Clostridium lundense]|uniref:Ger(x)C family spore germination protein n=1 Tax=Clostridium lundense TaxID=319475 RepID=UPI000558345F|nr:Ger(x)C family spore germination protein [Clostridium lundense]
MKKGHKILMIIIIIASLVYYSSVDDMVEFAENLSIPIGIGYDVKLKINGEVDYSVPVSFYIFKSDGKNSSKVVTGEGYTLLKSREARQNKLDKKFFLGSEKVYVISDEVAKNGIKDIAEGIFNDPLISDIGYVAICSGKAEDILKYPVKDYSSSAEFIEGIIKNLKYNNFFHRDYKVNDIFYQLTLEGMNLVLPYIAITDDGIEVVGMAIFKDDKMVYKLNMEQTRMLNFLREDNTQGSISVKYGKNEYVSATVINKRKVKCLKQGENYKFLIELKLKADINYDELKHPVFNSKENEEIIAKEMERSIEIRAKKFIDDMNKNYKIDVLQLGRVAAAKYGRRTGVNWDEVISNSQIDVDVKVKIDRGGRGNF